VIRRQHYIPDYLHVTGVAPFIDSHDKHWCIAGWRSDDDSLGSGCQVGTACLGVSEDSSRLNDALNTCLDPFDFFWRLVPRYDDLVAIHHQPSIPGLGSAFEAAMGGVIFQQVHLHTVTSLFDYHVVNIDEGIIDGQHLAGIALFKRCSQDDSADATESVDSKLGNGSRHQE
jgi:hypothetical protein